MKKIVLLCLLCVCGSSVRAQFTIPTVESPQVGTMPLADSLRTTKVDNKYFSKARWLADRKALRKQRNTIEFNINLAATQTQFVDWQAGGENTFTSRSQMSFYHLYKREKFSVSYRLDARYGANYIDKKLFKNEDEFKVNFQTGWAMRRNWAYAATVNLRSQFSKGVRSRTDPTKVSNFMAPGYLDVAVGFNWKKGPWDITVSPIAGSITMVLDEQLRVRGVGGVPKGDKTKGQMGPSTRIFFDQRFGKVFRYKSNAYSFTNIKTPPTVRWENALEIKATKFLTTGVWGLLYYDKYSGIDKPQYNYSLSIGLSYSIKNK